MKIRSFAKINLGLEVLKKREDNYHEIRTLFQTIDIFDILEIRPAGNGEICIRGDDESVPWNEDNLIFRAVLLIKERFHISSGIEVSVTKNIPPGKGLGGGSSNAAMTLYALNKIWGLSLKREDLMDLGGSLGADVPYFFEGGLCLGLERGDKIVPLTDLVRLFCLLVIPSFSISTASVYSRFQFALTSEDKESKISEFLTQKKFTLLENRLEETIFDLHPRLRAIKSLLSCLGAELSLVSGTGSAVFGLFSDRDTAERGLERLRRKNTVVIVETLSRERYWNELSVGV